MRIISGNFKGKKILQPTDEKTRPLRDLVKESIFNLIDHSKKIDSKIENSNILDLFSGCGSFGLECISRKAKKVTFVENYKIILSILKKNILSLNAEKNCKIIDRDCFDYLNSINNSKEKYDFIFIDPPYKETKITFIVNKIKENKILENKGVLIIHRHKKDDTIISDKLNILDIRDYGISRIIIAN